MTRGEGVNTPEIRDGGERDIKYSLPFKWGALRVTQSADEHYHLTPLTADKVDGDIVPQIVTPNAIHPKVDVLLLGPDEAEFVPNQIADFSVSNSSQISNGYIHIQTAMDATPEIIKQQVIDELVDVYDVEAEELEEHAEQTIGIPFSEVLEQDAPQILAHVMITNVQTIAANEAYEYMKLQDNKRMLKVVTASGAAGLWGASVMAGAQMLAEGRINGFGQAFIGGAVLFSFASIRHRLKKELDSGRQMDMLLRAASSGYGDTIAEDIHRVYCAKHFNQMAEQMLNPEPETD